MAEEKVYERTLEDTPTWAVAAVFFVLIAVSVVIEHLIHIIGKVRILNLNSFVKSYVQ